MPEIMAAVGRGSDGADHLVGTMHSDVLAGGRGDDVMEGGDDADLYIFKRGDGNDRITDIQTNPLLRAADVVVLGDKRSSPEEAASASDISAEDLLFSREGAFGDDLRLTVRDGGGTLLIEGQFAYSSLGYNAKFATNSRIEIFAFANYGESWTNHDVQQILIAQGTTAGADTVRGFGDDDEFAPSAGNDIMIGMDGADAYHWGTGAGNDSISEQAQYIDINVGLGGISLTVRADTVYFSSDIVFADLVFSRPTSAPDLVVTNAKTGETLTVYQQFAGFQTGVLGPQWFDRVEWFAFADGSRLSWQDVTGLTTTGGAGNDALWGDLLADTMRGGAGDDMLSGRGGDDTYIFNVGDGHDTIIDGDESFLSDGWLTIDQSPDILRLGPGILPTDVSFSRSGSSIDLIIGTGGDRITLAGQDDYINTGVFGILSSSRVEQVRFENGTIWTWADVNQRVIAQNTTSGNDTAVSFTLSDRFEKSAGDDVLVGGDSGDTYVFGMGAGRDTIRESVSNVLYGDYDTVEFDNTVVPSGVSVSRQNNDLLLTLASGDTLRIADEFDLQTLYTWTDIERFTFANGTVWSKQDIQQRLLQSTSGNDHLIGFYSADDLDGGAGNDILEGGDGSDTYHFGRGYGSDTIRESVTEVNAGDFDKVVFGVGLLPSDLSVAREFDDLVLTILNTGEKLRVENQFSFASWFSWNDVELFTFANGTSWTDLDIAARLTNGTPGNDHLIGTFRADVLDGGMGDDLLEGGDGADRYIFGRGYGHDEIRESLSDANLSEDDQLQFKPGITLADLGFTRDGNDLLVTILGTSDTLKITGQFNYGSWYTWQDVDRFAFSDGTVLSRQDVQQIVLAGKRTSGDDVLVGFMTGDTLDGGAGNDLLQGGDGGDTYLFGTGYGRDVIQETVTDVNLSDDDTVRFGSGITRANLTFSRSGEDLIVGIVGTNDTLTIPWEFGTAGDTTTYTWSDVEHFVFVDGSSMTKEDVQVELLRSTNGDDHLVGFYTNDIFDGGMGNDFLEGGRGSDVYLHNLGGGHDVIADYVDYWGSGNDRVIFGAGIAPADVIVRRSTESTNDMVLSVRGGESSVTLKNQNNGGRPWIIDSVEFTDGTVWTIDDLARQMLSNAGTSGNDVIDGTSGPDELIGRAGDDILRGYSGTDTLIGGPGNDRLEGSDYIDTYIYNVGDGDDVIFDYQQRDEYADILVFGAGIAASDLRFSRVADDWSDVRIGFVGRAGSIYLDNQHWGDAGIETVMFADGTVWDHAQMMARYVLDQQTAGDDTIWGSALADTIYGGDGNDTIVGGAGTDTIIGGRGNDRLEGNDYIDTYVYNVGDGDDVIFDYQQRDEYADFLVFGTGIGAADLMFSRVASDWNDVKIGFVGRAGSIYLDNQHWGDAGIESVMFADGTIWDHAQMMARYVSDQQTAGDDTIWGSSLADTIYGGAGNDTIVGGAGTDTIIGGLGNDRLEGNDYVDTYVYNIGDGDDVIFDYQQRDIYTDFLVFGAGITAADLIFSIPTADTQDLRITFKNYLGSVIFDQQAWSDAGIEEVKFADGTVLTADIFASLIGPGTDGIDDITANANGGDIWALEGNDIVNGSSAADKLHGQVGDDQLFGNAGDDLLDGGLGSDTMTGGAGNDVYVVDTITDQVIEAASAGTDRVEALLTYTLVGNVENLTLLGAAAINRPLKKSLARAFGT